MVPARAGGRGRERLVPPGATDPGRVEIDDIELFAATPESSMNPLTSAATAGDLRQ